MAKHTILAYSFALLAVCLGASCATPTTISGAKEPPLPLVKWDDLPIELKKASAPPYSSAAVKADLAECLSADLLATRGSFLACHSAASGLEGKAYAEQRRKCLIQSGAKPG